MVPTLLFMASVGQQPRYILPVLPPLAILLAGALTVRARMGARNLRVTAWLLAGIFLALAAALVRLRPMLVTVPPAAPWIGATLLAGAAATLTAAALLRHQMLPRLTVVTAAVFLLAVQFGALAGLRPEPVEQMATAVRGASRGRRARRPVPRTFMRNLVFYTGVRPEDLADRTAAVRFLQSPDRVLLVIPVDDLPGIEGEASIRTTKLFASPTWTPRSSGWTRWYTRFPSASCRRWCSSPTADALGCQPMRLDR